VSSRSPSWAAGESFSASLFPVPRPLSPTLPGLFVTGTDTGVGKTRVASAIARALTDSGRRVGVLKPVATGATRDGGAWRCADAEALSAAIGGSCGVEEVAPLLFEAPLAPPVAARLVGEPLVWSRVLDAVGRVLSRWDGRAEVMIVEGVGGLLCPLAEGKTVADLAVALDYPLVIVARRGLGTINHTLLTVEAARLRGLRVAGVVLNGAETTVDPRAEATNPGELARRLEGIPLLADLPFSEDPGAVLKAVDWYDRADSPRLAVSPAAQTCVPHRSVPLDEPRPEPLAGRLVLAEAEPMPEEVLCRRCGTRLPDRGKELICLACGTWFPGPAKARPSASQVSELAARLAPEVEGGAGAPRTMPSDAPGVLEDDLPGAANLLATPDPDVLSVGPGAPVLRALVGEPPGGDGPSTPIHSFASPGTDTDTVATGAFAPDGSRPLPGPASLVRVPAAATADFPALDLDRPPAPQPAPQPDPEEDDEFEEMRGTPWLNVLLLSYASAVTIACLWLWMHRGPAETTADDDLNVPVDTRPDPGYRADRTARVEPAPPLPADHLTTLGKPLRVGALELIPLDVRKGKVTLVVQGFDGSKKTSDGGDDALHLRVRLRNVSDVLIFAPLDEAFVRDRDRELPDSFIEAEDGERIYPYRLPVASERAILGQTFRELKPGEAMETAIVSDTAAGDRAEGQLTWRLRLRTGDRTTDMLGVRFDADQIR
jgi:dethiobiotin synthetase